MTSPGPLGIIAGGGPFPQIVAQAAIADGREIFVVALDGWADQALDAYPHRRLRISQAAQIFKTLHRHGCRELVFIGIVQRPARWVFDAGVSLLWQALRNLDLLWHGDSTLLSRIVTVFEREGFTVIGAHQVAPRIVLPAGTLGRITPSARDEADIEVGFRAALGLGALDIGQGVVVTRRRVIAAEAAEGTDAMLERSGAFNTAAKSGRAGVLVKCPKPIQDLRIDMPTIGPDTVHRAAAAKLAGIAVAAGRILAVDIDKIIEAADGHGLFVVARDVAAGQGG